MKKILSAALAVLISCALCACGDANTQTALSADEILAEITASQSTLPVMNALSFEEEGFFDYVSEYYALDTGEIEDGSLVFANGVEASEIAVFKLIDGADAVACAEKLSEYAQLRAGVFHGYAPSQSELAADAVIEVRGQYVALFICEDTKAAVEAFDTCTAQKSAGKAQSPLPVESAPTPSIELIEDVDVVEEVIDDAATDEPDEVEVIPEELAPDATSESNGDGVYDIDTDAILEAWRTNDISALSGADLVVFVTCRQTIEEIITADMNDYEKELAVHDWIIEWAEYDMEANSHAPDASPDPNNNNPYGLLVSKRAICKGYSTTFKLFMDMLDIECVIVDGASGSIYEPHSWNMVKLDGEWYFVDTGWDDPSDYPGSEPLHTYFNTTSDIMRTTQHHWDEGAFPEATSREWAWRP